MKKYNLTYLLAVLLLPLVLLSCQRETITAPVESTKVLNGTWKITKALRNGTDLTNRFDFSGFEIEFQDSTYSVNNQAPFPVTENGSFHLDDPNYPFRLFLQTKTGDEKQLDMEYPVKDGLRNIIIRFSPGCPANTYQYTLQQVN